MYIRVINVNYSKLDYQRVQNLNNKQIIVVSFSTANNKTHTNDVIVCVNYCLPSKSLWSWHTKQKTIV